MGDIVKYGDFVKEGIELLVLDVVIDDNGVVHNGTSGTNLIKGNISQKKIRLPALDENGVQMLDDKGKPKYSDRLVKDRIIGTDGESYPAGIDKNGRLVAIEFDGVFPLSSDGSFRIVAQPDYKIGRYWRKDRDYVDFIPNMPTGWVNIKIDMELFRRVSKISKNVGTRSMRDKSFLSKLADLSKSKYGGSSRRQIQRGMSAIILLHIMNEIRNFFTPSSAGNLFESYVAGLIPNAKLPDDNGSADVVADGKKYQIKLYSEHVGSIEMVREKDGSLLDYYVIALKGAEKIDIYVITTEPEYDMPNASIPATTLHYTEVLTRGAGKNISVSTLKTKAGTEKPVFSINLNKIDDKIISISKELNDGLKKIYTGLSEFSYTLDSIVTGVDKNGKIMSDEKFNDAKHESGEILKTMQSDLEGLLIAVEK